jgi:hypothetical protein
MPVRDAAHPVFAAAIVNDKPAIAFSYNELRYASRRRGRRRVECLDKSAEEPVAGSLALAVIDGAAIAHTDMDIRSVLRGLRGDGITGTLEPAAALRFVGDDG